MKLHCIAKHIGAFAFLIFILLVAGWIRIQGIPEIPEGQFTSPDAYFYYRQVSIITDQGKLQGQLKFQFELARQLHIVTGIAVDGTERNHRDLLIDDSLAEE